MYFISLHHHDDSCVIFESEEAQCLIFTPPTHFRLTIQGTYVCYFDVDVCYPHSMPLPRNKALAEDVIKHLDSPDIVLSQSVTGLNFWGLHMGVSKNRGFPNLKWMVKIMENPMNKWMIWGGIIIFGNTHICWVWPPHSNSDHRDYYIFSRGSL